MMVAAPLCWSLGGLLVRALAVTNAWEIVFWRSLAMVAFVAVALALLHGRGALRAVRAIGGLGVLSAAFLAGTFFFFIGSLTRTTVANTFVLMSVGPLLAAIAGRVVLGERVPARTWLAMGLAAFGIALMFADGVDRGQWLGTALALGVPVCFALNLVIIRGARARADMLPTVMVAGVLSMVLAFPLAGPLSASGRDLAILALMGSVQLGLGCLLMTAASRHLAASEIGLLALLEPLLGPVWVWALMGERPSEAALLGGAVVLAAVLGNAAAGRWRPTSR